jgi:phosphatidylserine synthase
MTATHPTGLCVEARLLARIAGALYVLNTVTSLYSFYGPKNRLSHFSGLVATAAYIAVVVLFYILFKPVNGKIALLAAAAGMAGNAMSLLSAFHLVQFKMIFMTFFGFYCVLIGYLIYRSTFLPRILGALMAFAGMGYLTFLWPRLGDALTPYNYLPGALGEWSLTIWLLVKGVDQQRWDEYSSTAGR